MYPYLQNRDEARFQFSLVSPTTKVSVTNIFENIILSGNAIIS